MTRLAWSMRRLPSITRRRSDRRAVHRRPSRAGRDDRLSLRHRRQGPPAAAEEFCAVSGAACHQPDALVEQAAGLGGETRNVTVFFSDIEGFSLIAEKMSPDDLVSLMNEYLSAMTDVIESHGGYVDKYIGDSIVAVFGAPADDPDHAANAARAALECCTQLVELNRVSGLLPRGQAGAADRNQFRRGAWSAISDHSRRFNYSVMSDAVNLASRLEGANKFYGTTDHRLRDDGRPCRRRFCLARTRRDQGQGTNPGTENLRIAGAGGRAHVLTAGLDRKLHQRTSRTGVPREFARAATAFGRSADADRPASLFCKRAQELTDNPPGAGLGSDQDAAGEMTRNE